MKTGRSLEDKTSPDSASLSKPVTPGGTQGQDEEGSDPAKQDPKKSKQEKAKETERMGNKPLDAADK